MGYFRNYTFYTVVYHTVVDRSGVALFSYFGVCHTAVDHSEVNLFLLFYRSHGFLDFPSEFYFPLLLVAALLRSIDLLLFC